jgi:transposase
MSNYRRSWSKVGERTIIDNQQEYSNRYLYSAIDPINGNNFHMYSLSDVNTLVTKIFVDVIKKVYKEYHLIIVWDNAAFHKSKKLENKDLTIIFLPSYSPELNPTERFFQEIRKVTANQIFESIDQQEKLIEQALGSYMKNKESIKQLCGYKWIIDAWNKCLSCNFVFSDWYNISFISNICSIC